MALGYVKYQPSFRDREHAQCAAAGDHKLHWRGVDIADLAGRAWGRTSCGRPVSGFFGNRVGSVFATSLGHDATCVACARAYARASKANEACISVEVMCHAIAKLGANDE